MSVYISGMEMPKEGNETIIRIQSDGTVLDQYGHHLMLKAVPVPEHGRLGDLDDFAKRMKNLAEKAKNDGFDLGAAWYSAFVRHIELTPTIIPASGGNENE